MDDAPRRWWIPRLASRAAMWRLGVLALAMVGFAVWAYAAMVRMPGTSHAGPLPPATGAERALAVELRRDVESLAGEIGARNVLYDRALAEAEAWIAAALTHAGYAVERQVFDVQGVTCANISGEIAGRGAPGEIVVVGAHYDTCEMSPGANDNASGVAAVLALARRFSRTEPRCTLRFVVFVNEEPPFFTRADMGSLQYAMRCRQRDENVTAMLSLETIGCYLDEPGSQRYPAPFGLLYPSTGDFIAFVGNYGSRRLVRSCVARFRETTAFPSEGGALPGFVPGVGWSDHWAFWQAGYEALMVTDTAPYRYEHYHRATDTPGRLDYERMARVVTGVEAVVRMLAGE